ncbi:MAG: amidohydrolase [Anaerolineales bacterium]|nr:amidohydrolase [Anaerolineales bacterium]MCS7248485.1 amidohydrolase [Anaerolineales bacterium]MDW8162298.1 amidohydrolase [Anaerolineales bacterium]MDW8448074.1 amidohydrolase [Anaerolineales bacterium]
MLFHNATVLTMNPRREIILNGAVAVQDNRILAVGKTSQLLENYPEMERFDCKGNLLLPGLIDTHIHLAQAMIRGCADDLGLLDWLGKRVWVLQGNYTAEDGRASAALCILEMIKSGTTAFIEVNLAERYGFDGVAEVVIQSGIRGAIGKIVMDMPSYAKQQGLMHPGMVEDGETSLRNTLLMHEKWDGAGNGRLRVWFGPRTPGGVTPELYREVARLAKERNIGITMHLSEVREDHDYAHELGYRTPVEFALDMGLLGKNTVLAHCVWTDEQDWKILAETGTHVSHNPASNAKTATGIAPVKGMLEHGVNVSLGCDGGPSNNAYDMIRDMRLTSYLANLRESDPTVVPAETVLEMATINGAKALGMADQLGSIEAGKLADFIIVNMDAPHLTPSWDPVSTLVYAAHGSDVDTVVIDGKIVMEHRQVKTLDEEAIVNEARWRAREVALRAGLSLGPRWPTI